jgi:hypothetical protein
MSGRGGFSLSDNHRRAVLNTDDATYYRGHELIRQGRYDLQTGAILREAAAGQALPDRIDRRAVAQAADLARMLDIAEATSVLLGEGRRGNQPDHRELPPDQRRTFMQSSGREATRSTNLQRLVEDLRIQRDSVAHPENPQSRPVSGQDFVERRGDLIRALEETRSRLPDGRANSPSAALIDNLIERSRSFQPANPDNLSQADLRQAARYHELQGARRIVAGAEHTEGRPTQHTDRVRGTALEGSALHDLNDHARTLAHPVNRDGSIRDFAQLSGPNSGQASRYTTASESYEQALTQARPPVDPEAARRARLAELIRRNRAHVSGAVGVVIAGGVGVAAGLASGSSHAQAATEAGQAALMSSPAGVVMHASQRRWAEAAHSAIEQVPGGFVVTEISRPVTNVFGLLTGQGRLVEDSMLSQALAAGSSLTRLGVLAAASVFASPPAPPPTTGAVGVSPGSQQPQR